jgi:hypothetical protein
MPSRNPAAAASARSRFIERIRRLRNRSHVLPAAPARKPKEPQGTTVIAHKRKAVLTISTTLGLFDKSGRAPVGRALSSVMAMAGVTIAMRAPNALAFRIGIANWSDRPVR